MKKIFYSFLCCCICPIVSAGENAKILSGGTGSSSRQVRIVGIGLGVSGRGQAPLVGLGLPFAGKRKAVVGVRQPASAPVRVTVSEISSEFKLGEVYVYPNPAKGGQISIFHVEAGLADIVKITVYDVSGDVVHNYTISGQPGAVNDGNGLEYAYEYAWRGHIPSGVYYFVVEAQKAEKKLRKTGRFAVIR